MPYCSKIPNIYIIHKKQRHVWSGGVDTFWSEDIDTFWFESISLF